MSFGSLSAPAKEALGRGASAVGTSTTTGDGGMTPEEREHSSLLVYQVLPSRYGMEPDQLRKADAIEVVVGPGRQARRRRHAARAEDLRPGGADAHPAPGHRPALGLPASGLDRARRSRDQDPGAARDHRLGEADLRQGRRGAALLRHGAGGESRRRRGGAGRHAGRHGGDARRVHRALRHPDAGGHPAGGQGAAGARHAPQGAADRLRRHPQRRRRGQGPGARRRCRLDRHGGADRARRQPPALGGGVPQARHHGRLLRRLARGPRPRRHHHAGPRAHAAPRSGAGRQAARQLPVRADVGMPDHRPRQRQEPRAQPRAGGPGGADRGGRRHGARAAGGDGVDSGAEGA